MSSSGYQSYPDPAPAGSQYGSAASAHNPQHGQYAQSSYPNAAGGAAAVGPSVVSPYSPNLSPHFSSTTVMLSILALISLYEGTLRVIENASPTGTYTATYDSFPAAALLVGGILESIYALMALFIGIWALLFDWHSVCLTTFALVWEILGLYTVIVEALALPAFNYDHNIRGSGEAQISLNEGLNNSRASYVFGWVLPLLSVDLAVWSGIIFFTIQLMQIQTNRVDDLHEPRFYSRRLGWWSLLQIVLGVSQIIFGAITRNQIGDGQYASAINFYPNLTTYAGIIILSGILFTFLGVMGFIASCSKNLRFSNLYIGASWLTFLYIVAVHIMTSCAVVNQTQPLAGYGLSAMGVLFGTLLIPMYLAYKSATIETVERGHYQYGPQQNLANRPMVV